MNRPKTALMITVLFLTLGLVAAVPAVGDQIVFDFVGHDDVEMDAPWTEQGLELVVHAIPGGYHVASGTLYGFSLGYAELSIDVSPLVDFHTAVAVLKTNFGDGNNSFLTFATSEGDVATAPSTVDGVFETLTLTRNAGDVITVRVGGVSLLLQELTLRYSTVPAEQVSWSRVKFLYR